MQGCFGWDEIVEDDSDQGCFGCEDNSFIELENKLLDEIYDIKCDIVLSSLEEFNVESIEF